MYLESKARLIGGIAMMLLAISTVAIVVLTATSGVESDPGQRNEAAQFLREMADNQRSIVAAASIGIFSDAVLAVAVSATLFVLFRDRSAFLAPIMLVGTLCAATMSATNDVLNIVATFVAHDFVHGGPSGVAGEPGALELGRVLGMLNFGLFIPINVAFGLALISLGAVISFAPEGAVNPPRWLGWFAMVSAVACWSTPLVFVHDAFFIFFPVQLITMLVTFIGLGSWLVMRGEKAPRAAVTATAQPGLAG